MLFIGQVENFRLLHEKAEEQAKQLSKKNSQLNGELEGKEARLSELLAASQDLTAKGKQIEDLLRQEKNKSTDLQHNVCISLSLSTALKTVIEIKICFPKSIGRLKAVINSL